MIYSYQDKDHELIRQRVESDVKRFLAAGGRIKYIPRGKTRESEKTDSSFSYLIVKRDKKAFNQPLDGPDGKRIV
jgi:hypothetical protein